MPRRATVSRLGTSRRLLAVFLLVSAFVVVALGLLVRRALQSAAVERAALHRAVADRVLDEMERELTLWLQAEESRPYEEYRFFVVPAEAGLRLERSPLSRPPALPFVRGYFQVEPDGTVTSPRWPGNESLAAETGWRAVPAEQASVAAVRGTVEGWLSAHPGERARAEPESSSSLESKLAGSAQSYLQSLNRAADERQQRASKLQKSQASSAYNFQRDEDNLLQQVLAPQLGGDGGEAGAATVSPDVARQVAQEVAATRGEVDVRLEPMVGRGAAGGQLLLYRTVVVGGRVYRQGALLDGAALTKWLAARVLDGSALAGSASLQPVSSRAPPPGGFAYPHRFAEPFGGLRAVLLLAPLPELAGDRYVVALSALLALATGLGLLALYRMAAVALRFAERRSNFVSAVTHELKTPLTAIRMYAEMLRDGMVRAEAKRQECYGILTTESERLSRLLDNVLELGRLERGQRPMLLQEDALAPVVDDVLRVLRPHAESKGFALRLAVEEGLPAVGFERDALSQVLFNLVENALKYARETATKEVLVSLRPAGRGVALTVRDHGPGVPAPHLRHVFEPFYRGEDELTRTTSGAGIGLSLVRQLVERMGGRVAGRNHPGGGFEVTVTLPGTSG
jgi:signal transduction histidine kinase